MNGGRTAGWYEIYRQASSGWVGPSANGFSADSSHLRHDPEKDQGTTPSACTYWLGFNETDQQQHVLINLLSQLVETLQGGCSAK